MQGDNGGTFTYQLDSGPVTTVATQGNNSFTFPLSSSSQTLGGVRIPVMAGAGNHTVNIAVTSTTSASNNVTIMGLGTTAGIPYHGSGPMVYLGGQTLAGANGPQPTAVAAFNSDQMTQANQLAADGLGVSFVNIEGNLGNSDYINPTGNAQLNSAGQGHISESFGGAMQYIPSAGNIINPLDYGASCNAIFFTHYYNTNAYNITITPSSPTISITNYIFQPGTATQNGGGDVGKKICFNGIFNGPNVGDDLGPCTYIASVNTSANTANVGVSLPSSGGTNYATAVMSGYPLNPNDPSTAADDTIPLQNAWAAAAASGSKVVLPTNCAVHNAQAVQGVLTEGNNAGTYYLQNSQATPDNDPITSTILYCDNTTTQSDDPVCIDIHNAVDSRWQNFTMVGLSVPFFNRAVNLGTGLGYSTTGTYPGGRIFTDNMSYTGFGSAVGEAVGFDVPVQFTASIAATTSSTALMTVTTVSSNNINANYALVGSTSNFYPFGNNNDFLWLGRTITGANGAAGTIVQPYTAGCGQACVYTLATTTTVNVASEAMTAPASKTGWEFHDNHSQYVLSTVALNGDFTDSEIDDSICSGTNVYTCWRLYNDGPAFGNGGNRWNGGRMEEVNGSNGPVGGVVCSSCGVSLQSVDFDFNGGFNVVTSGSNTVVAINGGDMAAGGHCNTGTQNQAMIQLGGTNPQVTVDGVALSNTDVGSGCGGSTTYLFSTNTGANLSSSVVSVSGGVTKPGGSAGTITGLYNWANTGGVGPANYKQDTAGWTLIDTTQSALSVNVSGIVGIGTSSGHAGTALDMLSNTTTLNSSLGLPGGSTATRPTTPIAGMFRYNSTIPAIEAYYGSAWNTLLTPANLPSVSVGQINGLTLSNDLVTPNTIFDIASGSSVSDDGLYLMVLPNSLTKTTSSWVVGGGTGCLDSGSSLTSSTWYYVFLIERTDTSVVDVACDTSLTTPALPANYTEKRFIGALETTTTPPNIVQFVQYGSGSNVNIAYKTPLADVSTALVDTTSHLETLTVPPGLNVRPYGNYSMAGTSAILWSSPDVFPGSPSATIPFTSVPGFSALEITSSGYVNTNLPNVFTNTSGQIALQATASTTTVAENTFGYQLDLTQQVPNSPSINISFLNGTLPTGVTLSRTTTGWYFNSSGYLTAAGPNVGRFDYATPGSSTLAGMLSEPQETNYVIYSRDMTQSSVWTPTNATIALTTTGIDGVANTASTITATSDNASSCQTITKASGQAAFSVYLQRITGTGTIDISLDGGSTSALVATTSAWTRFNRIQSLANPDVCVIVSTSGDAVAADVAQVEYGNNTNGFITSPIVTTTTSVTRAADAVNLPIPSYNKNSGAFVYSFELGNTGNAVLSTMFGFNNSGYAMGINNGNFSFAGRSISFSSHYNAVANWGASYSAPAGVFSTVYNGASEGTGSALANTATSVNFGGVGPTWVRAFEYWPFSLSTAALQTLAPSP